jgi:hypothetical protein
VNWVRSRRLPLFERIPVRWRIAITTAGLTLLILVCFALVLGQVVGNRIRGDQHLDSPGTPQDRHPQHR